MALRGPGGQLRLADLVENPELLLYQVNLARRELSFLEVTSRTFDESSFLDDRIAYTLGRVHGVNLDELAALMGRVPRSSRPVHFLAHTSFCCSTLLARSLRFEGRTLVLREPLILRLLGDARRQGERAGTLVQQQAYLDMSLRLLNKPYREGEQVIIKPANLANGLLDDWLSIQPAARGVILTSRLEDFLLSVLKKPVATREKMPWVAEALGMDTDYFSRLPEARGALEDPLRAAAVAWHAQRYALEGLLDRYPGRLLAMDQDDLLDRPEAAVEAVTAHLRLSVGPDEITRQVNGPLWHRHAKDPRLHYDRRARAVENARLAERHSGELRATLDWARDRLLDPIPVRDRLPGTWEPPSRENRQAQGA